MNSAKLNRLRAAVLGANDGIISVATALVALMGILDTEKLILTAVAVTLAGAISMASGEYVSVGAQRDAEKAAGHKELTSPFQAALSSFVAFTAGALIPALVACFTQNIWFVIGAVILTLSITAIASTDKGFRKRAIARMVIVGSVALTISFIANLAIESLS